MLVGRVDSVVFCMVGLAVLHDAVVSHSLLCLCHSALYWGNGCVIVWVHEECYTVASFGTDLGLFRDDNMMTL
jgi:hypothetical protein